MKRILVITNNLDQASFRLRIAALVAPLATRGFELDVKVRPRGLLARRRLLRSADRYDAVILQRKLLDFPDARLLRHRAKKLFYDVDDAVMFHNSPTGALSRWRTWRRFVATARRVDRVVAGNQYLADLFTQQGAAVSILPTVVDVARYNIKDHQPTDTPRLVWIGSHSTLAYIRQFLPALQQSAKVVSGLKLLIIADQTIAADGIEIEHIPWSAATECHSLILGDIGIAPTPTDRWTLGKCGFKIVQYLAAGLPVIASPVGANAELVTPQTGLLPEDPSDWPGAIAKLACDPELRKQLGAAGRKRAQELYSLQRATDFWAQLLAED